MCRKDSSLKGLQQSTGLVRVICLALAVLAGALTTLRCGAAELPSAEQVFQRHVEAVGGSAVLRKPRSLAFRGEADLIPLKAKAPIEILAQAPDRFYLRLKYHHAFFGRIRVPFVGVRQPECGYDGTNGWTVDFERKVEPMSGSEAVFFRAMLDDFSPLYASRHFYLTRTLDIERFAERDCYRVLLVLPTGRHAFEYYDVERGQIVGAIYPFITDDGAFNVRMTWSDYRPLVCGLRVPFQIDFDVMGQRYVLRAKEIQTDEAGFAIPASKTRAAPPRVATLKPDAKPAQAIIDRYIEALGGEAAIRAHHSIHVTGQLRHPGHDDLCAPFDVFSAVTNRYFLKVQFPSGLRRQGCDGRRFWRATGTDVHFATGKDLEQRLAVQDFNAVLHAPEGYRSMETLGTIDVDGRTCSQLLLVRKSGEVLDEFYDAETGLLRRQRTTFEGSGGGLELVQTSEDYRRFGNRNLPARLVYSGPGVTEELTISKVEWDNVPDSIFDLPPDLKAVAEQKTSAAAR